MTDQEINEAVARKLGVAVGKSSGMPDYCHDVKAAGEIVEFLKPRVVFLFGDMQPLHGWSCEIWTPMTEEPDCTERADTSPMVICLAFLKLQSN